MLITLLLLTTHEYEMNRHKWWKSLFFSLATVNLRASHRPRAFLSCFTMND